MNDNGELQQTPQLVLTVEDDGAASLLLGSIIRKMGHRVAAATTGAEALRLITEETPDLVLLDLGLPDMTGFEVAEAIRADFSQTQLPIIFVSGEQSASQRVRGFRVGGSDFLTKPYDTAEIESRISHQLEILRLRRNLEQSANLLEARVAARTADLRILSETDPVTHRLNERGFVSEFGTWRVETPGCLLLAAEILDWETFTGWLGHFESQAVLVAFADRISRLTNCGPIGRLGANLFVFGVAADGSPERTVESIHSFLQKPLEVGERLLRVTVALGAVVDDTAEQEAVNVLQEVNLALMTAKRSRESISLLDQHGRSQLAADLDLERDLWHAVENDELFLQYQPIFDAEGHLTAFESLVRWKHPTKGLISPGVFIPMAERNGAIDQIGDWTISEATNQLAQWRARRLIESQVRIAVNLSSVQAVDENLPARVDDALKRAELPAANLEIELTETAVIDQGDRAAAVLERLRNLGASISLDDFGTGASSLQLLQTMPADVVKIDRSFVDHLLTDPSTRMIIEATVGLAQNLGKTVVAEGIETVEQHEALRAMNCDEYQGFLLARPMDPDVLERMVGEWRQSGGDAHAA